MTVKLAISHMEFIDHLGKFQYNPPLSKNT